MRHKAGRRLPGRHPSRPHSVFSRVFCSSVIALISVFATLQYGTGTASASNARSDNSAAVLIPIHIRGSVLRSAPAHSRPSVVPDAVVSFCSQPSEVALIDLNCNSLATTVSDANGDFDLSLEIPAASRGAFLLEARGPSGQIAVFKLKGDPTLWPASVRLVEQNAQTRREQLERHADELRHQAATALQQIAESEARLGMLRLRLADEDSRQSVLQGRLALGAPDSDKLNSQIGDLRKQEQQTAGEIDVLKQKEIELKKQREKINADLTKILEQQGRDKHQVGTDTHRVYFGTDRATSKAASSIQLLNLPNPQGETTMGICEASIGLLPDSARPDRNLKSSPDADHYYAVESVEALPAGKFWSAADSSLESSDSHDALLYIHGYRSSFNDACRRAAQIAADLKFTGPVYLWSWPSRDELSAYFSDEKMAAWSSDHFLSFLQQLLARRGLHHLHIIAHSMGNRVMEQALISPQLTPSERAHLGQIVFAAPDLSRSEFDSQCNPASISALRITLYASRHDQALRAAKMAHSFPRLGDANPDIDVRPGMDSVDASAVDTSLLGHSYIGNSRSVLADVATLISSDADPGKRGLERMGHAPRQWWVLAP